MFLPGDLSSLPPGANQPALALESLLAAKTATPPANPLLPPLLAALAGNLLLLSPLAALTGVLSLSKHRTRDNPPPFYARNTPSDPRLLCGNLY